MVARPHRSAEGSEPGAEPGEGDAGDEHALVTSPETPSADDGGRSPKGASEAGPSEMSRAAMDGGRSEASEGPDNVSSSESVGSAVPLVPSMASGSAEGAKPKPRRQTVGPRKPPQRISSISQSGGTVYGPDVDSGFSWDDFLQSGLPKKLGVLLALIAFSRLGVYIRLPGVDVDAFADSMKSGGLLGYVDALSGGSISKVGLFSLGIIPYINSSILLQILAAVFPALKKLQREEGPQGRARFQFIQKMLALVFALVQAVGQLTYIRPFVTDWSLPWLATSSLELTAGAAILIYVSEVLGELQLGNGTSLLIFANIASALPTSLGATLQQATKSDVSNLAVFGAAFFLTTLGIVYVQEAERRIPMNYASRYRGALQGSSYLPFKVNATGVMPVIFASSLLAIPSTLARNTDNELILGAVKQLYPGGQLYLPVSVALIAFFNWYYTFIQLDPKDVSEQLKKQGASIPDVRPGNATTDFITKTLNRMSVLGSAFLGALAAAPAAVEALTHLTAFRGFAGTSVLILVGVATDTARRVSAEQAMGKYKDLDQLYKDMTP